ncbi:MAG: endo-1,3-alpha-glucanase family glycosylhydrolase [Victivallales bacterium]
MKFRLMSLLLIIASPAAALLAAEAGQSADPFEARRARLDERPKKIFAHYMVCYRIGLGAISPGYLSKHVAPKTRHDTPSYEMSFGNRDRGTPLLPDEFDKFTLEESADLEIRRAMRAGIDGFAFDVLPLPEDQAFAYMDAMFKVAEEKNYPFEITWCLDNAAKNPVVVEYIIKRHGNSPKIARRDGKVLFFGYQSIWTGQNFGSKLWSQRPEWQGKEVGTYAAFRCTPEGLKTFRGGFRELEERFSTPMYFQFSMGGLYHGVKHPIESKSDKPLDDIGAAAVLAEDFEAVCDFSDTNVVRNDAMAKAVRSKGAEWGEPLIYQYENLLWTAWTIQPGSDLLRKRWERARENGATLLQLTTWNDYTELTNIAPTDHIRYTLMDLTGYFASWWKTGKPPVTDHDRVYLIYPPYQHDNEVYPFRNRTRWRGVSGVIEVLTILTAPATVRLPGRDATWDAPAGLSWKQVPLTPGPVVAELLRGGKSVLQLNSPDPVTSHPFREQHSMICFSTEDLRHWRADFGDASPDPILRSEYGDTDGDGLPKWFEMYWFGKFGDWKTADVADPKADTDSDGRTNLEEYLARTNPTLGTKYPLGYSWDFFRNVSSPQRYNPEYDEFDTPVWYYLQQYVEALPLKHDGNYWRPQRYACETVNPSLKRSKFSPWWNTPTPHSRTGEIMDVWAREGEGAEQKVKRTCVLTPGMHGLQVLAWQSPVSGKVRVDFSVAASGLEDPITVTVEHSRSGKELFKCEYVPLKGGKGAVETVDIQPGDRLYLVADSNPGKDIGSLTLDSFKVTLLPAKP